MDLDLCLANGKVVTPAGSFRGDVGVAGGKIAVLSCAGRLGADQMIDATGLLVLPGAIDPHVHFHVWERPFAEDCRSETAAAAAGGVTTMGIYAVRREDGQAAQFFERGGGMLHTIGDYRRLFDQNALVDGYFQIWVPDDEVEKRIQSAFEEGISFFKFGGARVQPSDAAVVRALKKIKELGPPAKAFFHCENIDICRWGEAEMEKTGRKDPEAFQQARPAYCEAESMERYIRLAEATGCPIYIVHITIAEGPEIVARAKRRGVKVVAETCPPYLTHTSESKGIFREKPHLARVFPPLRDLNSNERLWQGLREGTIDVVGTDHSPRRLAEKGKTVWEGAPGLGNNTELMLPVLFSEGVKKGRLSLEQLVRVTSYNTARHLGLYPQKGGILIGADADLVLIDPEKRVVLSPAMLHSRCDYSIYEGWEFTCWPVCTIVRGQVIFQEGRVVGRPGTGRALTVKGAG